MYNSRKIGTEQETKVIEYLKDKGYVILEKNFRNRDGEIDIIAKNQEYLVFVEVKYRSNTNNGHPLEAVTLSKQKNICKVSRYYMKIKGYGLYTSVRYDVIGILKDQIVHVENAFSYVGKN